MGACQPAIDACEWKWVRVMVCLPETNEGNGGWGGGVKGEAREGRVRVINEPVPRRATPCCAM